jgi:hypothetical protein
MTSSTVLKTTVVYDIFLVYAKIFMFFNQLHFYGRNNNKIATAGLNQYAHMDSNARDTISDENRKMPNSLPNSA